MPATVELEDLMAEDTVQMQERLVRVETKLDLLIAGLEPRHTGQDAKLRELEANQAARVRELEGRLREAENVLTEIRTRVALVAGGTGTAGGILTAILAHFVGA